MHNLQKLATRACALRRHGVPFLLLLPAVLLIWQSISALPRLLHLIAETKHVRHANEQHVHMDGRPLLRALAQFARTSAASDGRAHVPAPPRSVLILLHGHLSKAARTELTQWSSMLAKGVDANAAAVWIVTTAQDDHAVRAQTLLSEAGREVVVLLVHDLPAFRELTGIGVTPLAVVIRNGAVFGIGVGPLEQQERDDLKDIADAPGSQRARNPFLFDRRPDELTF